MKLTIADMEETMQFFSSWDVRELLVTIRRHSPFPQVTR